MKNRLSEHICDYKRFLIGKQHFISSYHLVNYENVQIILIENFACQTNSELCKREGYYIRNIECVNKCIPGRTQQEYSGYYHTKNKARIHARKNTKFVCDCGGPYTRAHRARHIRSLKHKSFIGNQE